jgi:hypothetical protein
MRWQDVASLTRSDLENIPIADLRKYASQLNSAANKRSRNLEKNDLVTPATTARDASGGDFSIRGKKSRDDVIEEMTRAKRFLRSSTSTVKGARKHREQEIRDLEELTDADEHEGWEQVFDWGAYYKVLNHAMEHKGYIDSERIKEKVFEIVRDNPGLEIDSLIDMIDEWANEQYTATRRRRRRV